MCKYQSTKTFAWGRIHDCWDFLNIILRVLRLEVSVYNVFIKGVKGGGVKQGGKLLRLLSQLRPRIRPLGCRVCTVYMYRSLSPYTELVHMDGSPYISVFIEPIPSDHQKSHRKKSFSIFPSPAGMSLTLWRHIQYKLQYYCPGRVW
jgi:hypothetical protein